MCVCIHIYRHIETEEDFTRIAPKNGKLRRTEKWRAKSGWGAGEEARVCCGCVLTPFSAARRNEGEKGDNMKDGN